MVNILRESNGMQDHQRGHVRIVVLPAAAPLLCTDAAQEIKCKQEENLIRPFCENFVISHDQLR